MLFAVRQTPIRVRPGVWAYCAARAVPEAHTGDPALRSHSTDTRWRRRRPGLDAAAAVDLHRHAGDHRRLVAAQEAGGVAQVLRGREAADRDRRQEPGADLGLVLAHEG